MGNDIDPDPQQVGRSSDKTKEVIDEILTRDKYEYKVDSCWSKLFVYCLRNADNHIQKVKKNGEKRLKKEMDFTWIVRTVRNQ